MAYLNEGSIDCCGIEELSGITQETPEGALREAAGSYFRNMHEFNQPGKPEYRFRPCCAFLFFSDHLGGKYGDALTRYIRANKLGSVARTNSKRNPNSGNNLVMYVWTVNDKRFLSLAKKKEWL